MTTSVAAQPSVDKMPGHWVLSRMGKRVLRPGGLELTRALLSRLAISTGDDVVEFAPGMGVTAQLILAGNPSSYTAIDRDCEAAARVQRLLTGPHRKCILGAADESGLPDASASVVVGEAMLSMQPASTKQRIVAEAVRLLKPNGRYGIHELCLVPDDVDESTRQDLQQGLSEQVHVGVRPLTAREWRELLESAGLSVTFQQTAPMHLLEPARLIRDEGLFRALLFAWNLLWHPTARRRVLAMRNRFRKFGPHLAAVVLVGEKRPGAAPV